MRSRHKIERYEGKKTTNTIAAKESKLQHEVIIQIAKWSQPKTDVATQKMEEIFLVLLFFLSITT